MGTLDDIIAFCTSNRGWFSLSYLVDWLIAGGMILTDIALTQFLFTPHERYVPKDFQELAYPAQQDVVPLWLWGLMGLILPILVFALFQMGFRSGHDFHHAMLGLVEAIAITLVLTDLLRYFAGRNTPDWYDRLRAGDAYQMKEGRLSFPSVHSALIFASLVHLSMYMSGKFGVFKDDGGQMWKAVTAIVPIGGAAVLAITKTMDYHNDFTDVLAGAGIGICAGAFAYFLNYPSLSSAYSERPKSRNDIYTKGRTYEDSGESLSTQYSFSTGTQ